jgi:Tol biopolymer transport system component
MTIASSVRRTDYESVRTVFAFQSRGLCNSSLVRLEKKIAYAVSRGSCANPSAIHVVNVDGSDDKALTHHRFGTFDQSPAWSPNGDEIEFQCAGGPIFGAICVLKLSNPRSIRFAAGTPFSRDFDPSWQPVIS